MLTTAAREGTHAPLLRAALTSEPPPWPTKTWKPILSENDRRGNPRVDLRADGPPDGARRAGRVEVAKTRV